MFLALGSMLLIGSAQIICAWFRHLVTENSDEKYHLRRYWMGIGTYFFIVVVLLGLLKVKGDGAVILEWIASIVFFGGAFGLAIFHALKLLSNKPKAHPQRHPFINWERIRQIELEIGIDSTNKIR